MSRKYCDPLLRLKRLSSFSIQLLLFKMQSIVGRVLYVSEAWRALCCCRALSVECCMSRKHDGPSVVAGHCGSSAVYLGSMVGPLLLQGIVGRVLYVSEAWWAHCWYLHCLRWFYLVSAVGIESVESMVCPIQDLQY